MYTHILLVLFFFFALHTHTDTCIHTERNVCFKELAYTVVEAGTPKIWKARQQTGNFTNSWCDLNNCFWWGQLIPCSLRPSTNWMRLTHVIEIFRFTKSIHLKANDTFSSSASRLVFAQKTRYHILDKLTPKVTYTFSLFSTWHPCDPS